MKTKFEMLAVLKREKRFDESLSLIDDIEAMGTDCEADETDYLRRFVLYSTLNKERSIVYRKLRNKQLTEYYLVISELGWMINAIYRINAMYLFVKCYFTDGFIFSLSKNPNVAGRVREYVEWFKPIVYELNGIHTVVQKEISENFFESYKLTGLTGNNLEKYLYKKTPRFVEITQEIESNMPHHFLDKSLFL